MCADGINNEKESAVFVIDESACFDDHICKNLKQVHLNLAIFGKDLNLTVGFVDSPVRICDIIPPAQALCDRIVKTAVTEAKILGWKMPCTKGCNSCCRNPIPLSVPEALWLNEEINRMPKNERKVLQRSVELAYRRLISAETFDFICPFLSENACMIYRSRPLACREYVVTGDHPCDTQGNQRNQILQLPVSILKAITCLYSELEENEIETMMLPTAIHQAKKTENHKTKTYYMSELLDKLIGIVHQQTEKNTQSVSLAAYC